ncbi:MAG: hypothetical protein ACLQIB_38910 [Isosphaeraceae bacterium]
MWKYRHVVIKTFEAAGIDRDVGTLFREAQILDRLEHPGIVRLLDCGFADEAAFGMRLDENLAGT